MKKLQLLWVALLLLSAGAEAPGAETVPAVDGEKAQAAASSASVLYFPDYVDGGGWSVQLVLNNVDPSQSAPVEVEVYDQQGRSVPRFFGSGNRFEIPARGSRILRSSGTGNLRRGWIQVRRQTASVHGLLTYRHGESGIEVGVRPVPLNDHFALYVEESSDIGTGLAIFKPDRASEIEFRLRDEAGFDPLGRVLTQGNFQQRADVIPGWFAEAGTRFLENFRGLLFLRSSNGSGFAPMGLRGGKRKGSLSAVPVIPIGSDGGGGTLYFPDYVDGGGWSVQLALSNIDPNRSAPVEVEVYDQQGRPVPAFFYFGNRFEIPAGGSRVLRSPSGGSVQRGWIQVETDSASVHGLLTYRHADSGIEVGVEPVPLRDHFALYVEESSDIGTGLAIFKPDASSEIEFQLRDEAGRDLLGRVFSRGNFQQRAHVLPDWFAGVNTRFLENFRGLLFLRAADGSGFAPMGLRGGKRKGSLSAVPVIPIMSDRAGTITTVAGTGQLGFSGDGAPATRAELADPGGVVVDAEGNLYIADAANHRVRRVNTAGTITTLAGSGLTGTFNGGFGGDGGPAVQAQLNNPDDVVLDVVGNLYILDRLNHRVRRVDTAGTITTLAGSGPTGAFNGGFGGDGGPAVRAQLSNPVGIDMDLEGNLYIADAANHRVRKVDPDGIITTVAGTGTFGNSGDGGPALGAHLGNLEDVAVDKAGNLYIAEDERVRKVDRSGVITTVAGTMTSGFGGDGGPAIAAQLGQVLGVTVDETGNLYIADATNHRVRKVGLDGKIRTVVGGGIGTVTDGSAELQYPRKLATDAVGNLFITEAFGNRVLKVVLAVVAPTPTDDHGNDSTSATPLELNSSLAGMIETQGDEDWFRVETSVRRHLRVRTTGSLDTVGTLFDASGRQLVTNDDGGSGTNFALEAEVPAGVYYVRVQSFGSNTGTYTVEEHGEPTGDDHGNDRSGATPLELNSSLTGMIETSGDEDWFRVETSVRRHLRVRTTGSLDTVGTLFDTSGRQLVTNDDGGSGTNFAFEEEVPAGVYYVRVRGYGSNTGTYTVEEHGEAAGGGGGSGEDGGGKIYWTDFGTDKIQRANLDGTGVQDLVTSGLVSPRGLALDLAGGKMYWTDAGTKKIQRANLDGTRVQDLVTSGLGEPNSLALDLAGSKMYWTDVLTHYMVHRANLDGTRVEDLVTSGLGERPVGLALDLGSGKMYWTDYGAHKIQRANLDGTQVEDLVTSGLDVPYSLALDLGSGKMYWTDQGTDKIQRANLDGTQVEDLVTSGLGGPVILALDLDRRKMYWTNQIKGKIQRANLDGTGVQDLVTGLSRPRGLALDTSGAGQ